MSRADVYFSADVETDGPIPGPFSMLSFALVPAGRLLAPAGEGAARFEAPTPEQLADAFYAELRPISPNFEAEALAVNGLDREGLIEHGADPGAVMADASEWIVERCEALGGGEPVLVGYPLGFDWSWLRWYFIRFGGESPFGHSRAFDIKTAAALDLGWPVSGSGRARLPAALQPERAHSHHAVDDAVAQAQIFAKLMTRRYSNQDQDRA